MKLTYADSLDGMLPMVDWMRKNRVRRFTVDGIELEIELDVPVSIPISKRDPGAPVTGF